MQSEEQRLTAELFMAIANRSPSLIVDLLANNAKPRHYLHGYALIYALEKHPSMVRVLLAAGVNDLSECVTRYDEHCNKYRYPAIAYAAENHQWDNVQALLEYGLQKYDSPGLDFGSALLDAVMDGQIEIAKLLLKRRANPNWHTVWDFDYNSTLHLAVIKGERELVAMLLHAGANPNFQNRNDDTPLHCAITKGNPEVIGLLLMNAKTSISIQNKWYETALQLAETKHFFNPKLRHQIMHLFAEPKLFLYQTANHILLILHTTLHRTDKYEANILRLIFAFLYDAKERSAFAKFASSDRLLQLSPDEATARAEIIREEQAVRLKLTLELKVTNYFSDRSSDPNEYRSSKWPLLLRKKCGAVSREAKLAAAAQLDMVISGKENESSLTQHQAALNQGNLGKIYREFRRNQRNLVSRSSRPSA